ncbi:unnamed protein product [Mesocestoides corti]|uniref:BZIP domain-containing protein n=2 Tax=Mesocestoides corti TaxID=53468 RepID=A0A0R3UN90_MESCO|nr:unnamed protein product [Mesocestoides corti]
MWNKGLIVCDEWPSDSRRNPHHSSEPLDLSNRQRNNSYSHQQTQAAPDRRRRSNSLDADYTNPRMRRHPEMTPTEAKDARYWERRNRNNAAARRSRQSRRAREADLGKYAECLERQNAALEAEVRLLRAKLAALSATLNHREMGRQQY